MLVVVDGFTFLHSLFIFLRREFSKAEREINGTKQKGRKKESKDKKNQKQTKKTNKQTNKQKTKEDEKENGKERKRKTMT